MGGVDASWMFVCAVLSLFYSELSGDAALQHVTMVECFQPVREEE